MHRTFHLDAAKAKDLARAAELLRAGGTVAFATETVYGLGANAFSPAAVAKIFAAKQRPAWDPLIVHLASAADLPSITRIFDSKLGDPKFADPKSADPKSADPKSTDPKFADIETRARVIRMAEAFWPGPLTLLLPRNAAIPASVTAGRDLVGVRVPAHPSALELLRAAAIPVAAPSANTFGHTSPTTAAHVLADLDGRIDAVLDAGATSVGLESTVLDPTQTPMVLYRPGAISAEQIAAVTGVAVEIFQPPTVAAKPQEALPAPGVGLRHYAPRARLVLVEPLPDDLLQSLAAENRLMLEVGASVGLMLPEGWAIQPGTQSVAWGPWNDLEALARNLFACLRSLDGRGVEVILCPLPPPGGLADAIRDRLQKAARP